MSGKADRFNSGKSKLSYVLDAFRAIACWADVMAFGASKYSRGNWQKGLPKEEVIDSLLRHLAAYQNGEILDPESGLPHVGHIMANAAFLAEFELRGDYTEETVGIPEQPISSNYLSSSSMLSEKDIDTLVEIGKTEQYDMSKPLTKDLIAVIFQTEQPK